MRLIQLKGYDIEELYEFPNEITDEEIVKLYKDWIWFDAEESIKEEVESYTFEEYLENIRPEIGATRLFVDEIYL